MAKPEDIVEVEAELETDMPTETKKMSIREITDSIGKLYESLKQSVESSQEEGVPMSGETEAKYDRMNQRLTQLITMRDQHYRLLDAQASASKSMGRMVENLSKQEGRSGLKNDKLMNKFGSDEYRSAFKAYLQSGTKDISRDEIRALSDGTDADGGFLLPIDFYSKLIEVRYQHNAMRQVADVIPLGTFETEITIEGAFAASSYTAEAAALNEATPTFSNLTLKPHTLRYFSKVSNELMADSTSRGSAFSIENILSAQIGKSMAEKEERAFCTGSGASSPTGIFSYCTGTTTTISGVTTATNYTLTGAELMDVVSGLPRAYRDNAKWIMSDEVFYKLRKLLQVQLLGTQAASSISSSPFAPYAWSLGDGKLQDGEPDRLLGFPVICVNNGLTYPAAANAAGSEPVALFGDFSYFKIGEREGVSIKVARETFLANNQTGIFAFSRHGSVNTNAAAFKALRVKTPTT